MPKLSQDAIRELRQSLPLLKRIRDIFSYRFLGELTPAHYEQLEHAYNQISELISPTQARTWIGPPTAFTFTDKSDDTLLWSELQRQKHMAREISERLYLYVQSILETEKVEETLDRLAQENASLKKQLDELRRRESTYLSVIKEAQTSATYSPSLKDREILLDSYRRQRTILIKNLTRYQEDKAKHGLSVPVDILNAIDQTEEDLKQIDANIAALEEASRAETN